MPDDDDAIIVDTRRGAARPPRVRRRPAEEPQQIPVRSPGQGQARVPGRAPVQPGDRWNAGGYAEGFDSTRVMPTRGAGPAAGPGGRDGGYDSGRGYGGGGTGRPADPPAPARRPRRRKRTALRVFGVLVLVVALWAGLLVWAGMSAWGKVTKVDAFPTSGRPSPGKGTNVLLVGSDSRAGLTSAQAKALRTGGSNVSEGAAHTDSIMILHMSSSGSPTLVSIPRDSWVAIPGYGHGKINAAFTYGGPKLLVQTVEQATDLRIDDYMEIGFGGFAGVVDAVGGVRMCLPEAVKDDYAHINLPAGCQNLSGANALGYVRSRHAFATGDLARAEHQRQFLGALMKKIATPGNLLVPWRLKSIGESGAQGIAVNKGMSPLTALKIMWTLKGITAGGESVQVPVANANYYVDGQSTVLWDSTRATQLFTALRNDTPISVSQSAGS
ncbi:LCP family protein [Rudaeicoccus suwonensis]|uniref:LytR family transcriptional attenuator n=1 Tax=Rudaeicoccus suwonensis TaxID=657409 RepID=A0A561E945_9MICO|nr:LCP family protein [Rudaeicoccus suwonensis]TWE12097.1 LytR family transcriptional attenuator [Rudaeicoccus suwonensis]